MTRGRQTVERRQLGLMLKRLRRAADRSQVEAARAIGRDQTRVSRAEVGNGSLSIDELTVLLDLYGVLDQDRQTVLSLGAQARKRQRGATYTDVLPGGFQRLADLEADATVIRSYEVGIIPGLLQSPGYLHALINTGVDIWWDAEHEEIEGRVGFRLEQQHRVLDAIPQKELRFIFTEDALQHIVGDPSTMRSQLLHLLSLLEKQSRLTIQVLPAGAVDSPLLGGGFLLMDFDGSPRCGSASVVFGPCTYHDAERDTVAMLRAFRRVEELAFTPDESRSFLVTALREM